MTNIYIGGTKNVATCSGSLNARIAIFSVSTATLVLIQPTHHYSLLDVKTLQACHAPLSWLSLITFECYFSVGAP